MDITAIKEQLDQADKTRAALAELLGRDQPLNQTFNMEGSVATLQDPEHPLGGQTVICRTYTSGVSIGTLSAYSTSSAGYEIHLTDAIRLWQWKGAFTLSEVATTGPTSARCDKHPEAGVWMADRGIELLPMTDVAVAKLHEVATWGVAK